MRSAREATEPERQIVVGQWGLIPWFAKTPKLSYSTNNARFEELARIFREGSAAGVSKEAMSGWTDIGVPG